MTMFWDQSLPTVCSLVLLATIFPVLAKSGSPAGSPAFLPPCGNKLGDGVVGAWLWGQKQGIKSIERCAVSHASASVSPPGFEVLESFAHSKMVRLGTVELTNGLGFIRGLIADRSISKGETIASVQCRDALSSSFRLGDDPWYTEMAARLMLAAEGDGPMTSFAKGVIDAYDGETELPTHWPEGGREEELLRELVGERAVDRLTAYREHIRQLADKNVPDWLSKLGAGGLHSQKDITAALEICLRRAFLDSDRERVFLLPVFDLANHPSNGSPNVRAEFTADGSMAHMRALADIASGEEILNSYGAGNALSFLLTHGFVPEILIGEEAEEFPVSTEEGALRVFPRFYAWGTPRRVLSAWCGGKGVADQDMQKEALSNLRDVAQDEADRLETLGYVGGCNAALEGWRVSRIRLLRSSADKLALQAKLGRHIEPPPQLLAGP